MFKTSHGMQATESLAFIILIKYNRDPFFLRLLGLIRGSTSAPADVVANAGASATDSRANVSGVKRKRLRHPGAAQGFQGAASSESQYGASVVGARDPSGRGPPLGPDKANGAAAGEGGHSTSAAEADRASPPETDPPALPGGDAPAPETGRGAEERLMALFLMVHDRIVATASLHPEFSSFDASPVPVWVVSGFLTHVQEGCAAVIYPFLQHADLCLEKGNISPAPVSLGSIVPSYNITWPVSAVGYAQPFHCFLAYPAAPHAPL